VVGVSVAFIGGSFGAVFLFACRPSLTPWC
jgi:hypothetical protein